MEKYIRCSKSRPSLFAYLWPQQPPSPNCDDCRQGLEWQLQGSAPLGGRPLANVIGLVKVPVLGAVRFQDKARQLKAYMAAGVEACEMTVKRDGEHCVRGLQPAAAHIAKVVAVGIASGLATPMSASDGELITHLRGDVGRLRGEPQGDRVTGSTDVATLRCDLRAVSSSADSSSWPLGSSRTQSKRGSTSHRRASLLFRGGAWSEPLKFVTRGLRVG